MDSLIIHVDVDAFFASVEQLLVPALRGRPVIVGSGCIASCSYEARRRGLHAGMSLGQARRLCPEAAVLAGNYQIYRCFAEHVWRVCRRHTCGLETFLDEAYGDATGIPLPGGDALAFGRRLRQEVLDEIGLSVSVGLAANRMLAKIAAHAAKPKTPLPLGEVGRSPGEGQAVTRPGLLQEFGRQTCPHRPFGPPPPKGEELSGVVWVRPGTEAEYLAPLPVERIPGVGHKTAAMLHDMNIRTVAQMRTLPRGLLEAMLGRRGLVLYERCRGRDVQASGCHACASASMSSPPSARAGPSSDVCAWPQTARPGHPAEDTPKQTALGGATKTISRETTFHRPTCDGGEIRGMLFYLLERAMRTLRAAGLTAGAVAVTIRYDDFKQFDSRRALEQPTASDEDVFAAVLGLFERLYQRRVALRHVGVELANLAPHGRQGELFEPPAHARRRGLHQAVDAIRNRWGHAAIVTGPSIRLLGQLEQNDYGFVLRTPSLTK